MEGDDKDADGGGYNVCADGLPFRGPRGARRPAKTFSDIKYPPRTKNNRGHLYSDGPYPLHYIKWYLAHYKDIWEQIVFYCIGYQFAGCFGAGFL